MKLYHSVPLEGKLSKIAQKLFKLGHEYVAEYKATISPRPGPAIWAQTEDGLMVVIVHEDRAETVKAFLARI